MAGSNAEDLTAELKRAACAAVEARRGELLEISREIHAHPELAFQERRAAALLSDRLERAGLAVERGAYGLETAFAAEFGSAGGRAWRCWPSTTPSRAWAMPAGTT